MKKDRLCIYDWETGKVLCRNLRVLEPEGAETRWMVRQLNEHRAKRDREVP